MAALPPSATGPFSPGAQPFAVGSITLGTIECPAIIHFGKIKQTTVVTEITGGSRLVQTFGPQIEPVEVTGRFWANGASVEERVADFTALAVAGAEVFLSWSRQQYYGVITDFDPSYHNVARADWSMTVEITRDGNGAVAASVPPSVDTQVATLQTNAASANTALLALDPEGASVFQPQLTTVQTAIAGAGPLAAAAGTPANTVLSQALTAAQSAVAAYVNGLDSRTEHYGLGSTILTNLQLIARNVAQGQTAVSAVMPMGGSYWEQSVLAYGSVDQALTLAAANNATTMRTAATATARIVLPPYATRALPTPLPE